MNIYFRVQNLLGFTRNVVDVYTATGSPDDDGFLASSDGEDVIANILNSGREDDLDFFLESYSWRLLNPDHWVRPRRMYLGAIFEF